MKYSERVEVETLKDILKTSLKVRDLEAADDAAGELIDRYMVLSGNVLISVFSDLSSKNQDKIIMKAPQISEQICEHVEKKSKYYLNVEKILMRQRTVDSLELLKDVLLVADTNLSQMIYDIIETILVSFKQSWFFSLKGIQNQIYGANPDIESAKSGLYKLESLAEMVIQTIESLIFIVPTKVPAEAFLTMLFLGPNRYADIPFNILFDEDDPEVQFLTDYASWRIMSEALIDSDKKVSFCTREAIANNETMETPEFLLYCLQNKNSRLRMLSLELYDSLKSPHSFKGVMKLRDKLSFNARKKLIEITETIPYISICINNIEFLSKTLAYELLEEADLINDMHKRNLIYAQLLNYDDDEFINQLLRRFKRIAMDQGFEFLYNSLLIQIERTQIKVAELLLDNPLSTGQKLKVLKRLLKSVYEPVRQMAKNELDETTWMDLLGNVKSEIISLLNLDTDNYQKKNTDYMRKLKSKLISENEGEIIEGLQLIDFKREYSTEMFPHIQKLVRSKNAAVRAAAVRVLNKIDPKTTNDVIINTLNDDSCVNIKLSTLSIIEELDDKRYAVYLKQLFSNDSPQLKAKAIYLVYKLTQNDQIVLPELEKMLKSKDLETVQEALGIIKIFDKQLTIDMLETIIETHSNPKIKARIMNSLKLIRENI